MKIEIEENYITVDGVKYIREVKNELPKDFTGWCKIHNMGNDDWLMYFENGIQKYGIDSNNEWFVPAGIAKLKKYYEEATEQEVFEALKNEAVKRYKDGDYTKCLVNDFLNTTDAICLKKIDNSFINHKEFWISVNNGSQNCCVLKDGIWAEIIPVITKQEAEVLLNKKIV